MHHKTQESVHGSPVAPVCTIKKIKSSPICLQLGLVLFQPSARSWLAVCLQANTSSATMFGLPSARRKSG